MLLFFSHNAYFGSLGYYETGVYFIMKICSNVYGIIATLLSLHNFFYRHRHHHYDRHSFWPNYINHQYCHYYYFLSPLLFKY